MLRRSFFLLTTLIGALICSAQEEVFPPRTIRLLPVGDAPPFRQEIRDGVRYELAPPEGSVPPVQVEVTAFNEENQEVKLESPKGEESLPSIRLRLNQISSRLTLPGVPLSIRLQDSGSQWHQFEMPAEGDFLVVIWRDPRGRSWGRARSRLVPDGGASFKAGDLRFINVGPVTTGFIIGEQERFELGAGRAVLKSLGTSPGTPTEVVYQDPDRGGWRRLWSSALVQNRGERSTVVIYRADGVKPRRPLKLIAMRERAVPAPVAAPVSPPAPVPTNP